MAYTLHGHQIVGTVVDAQHPMVVARCGGPAHCKDCAREAGQYGRIPVPPVVLETHTDHTLFKVLSALTHVVGKQEAHECLLELQNAGILFRERAN